MSSKKNNLFKLTVAAMFLALAMILPFVTGQVPQVGNMLCPMHLPVLLCGFFCGQWYGLTVGAIAPLLRSVMFGGRPPLYPTAVSMCFELATYGFIAGMLYKALPKKPVNVYVSLIAAMIAGRVVWGVVRTFMYGLGKIEFGWTMFITEAFTTAIPGIVLQLVLIPILVIVLKKTVPKLSE